jgi:hypothetical protein
LGTEPLSGQKLTKLIYDKNSIVEILESIIEEKNRKIFYGNPVDIFLKILANLVINILKIIIYKL